MMLIKPTDNWCFTCGNKGFPDKVCPACGREPQSKSINLEFRENTEEFVGKIDAFGVPGKYRGIFWDAEVLRHSKPELEKDLKFDRFVTQLEKINNCFVQGILPGKSAIIIADAGFSKMTFAFSCIQRALDMGFSVAPLLDTVELKRLLVLSAEKPTYKLCGSIDYDSYIMSDVLFVTVTKLKQHEIAFEVIQELIDKRSRKGLSTIILSRYDLQEITKKDYTNQFDAIATAISEDSYKYPAVIMYKNRF